MTNLPPIFALPHSSLVYMDKILGTEHSSNVQAMGMTISAPGDLGDYNSGQQDVGTTNTIQTPQHMIVLTLLLTLILHRYLMILMLSNLVLYLLFYLTISDNNIGRHHYMVTQSQTINLKPKISSSFNATTTSIADPTSYS